jgi:hypothetical protein
VVMVPFSWVVEGNPDLTVIKKVGSGGSGDVYEVHSTLTSQNFNTGEVYALYWAVC